ncbi:hypothetical protein AFLA_011246 [Aspergillus flavus NRRL3357]|nr:hypothetical protein AFLA_011246 [Aspergillus flavus NRRL3357]
MNVTVWSLGQCDTPSILWGLRASVAATLVVHCFLGVENHNTRLLSVVHTRRRRSHSAYPPKKSMIHLSADH